MSNNKFEKVTIDEISRELNKFRSEGELLKVWQKGGKLSWQAKLREVKSSNDSCTINILPVSNISINKNEPVLITFQKDNIDFFCETGYVEKNGSIYQLNLLDKNYRVEKRSEPRYICYPAKEAYFTVKIPFPQGKSSEVLSFYKDKRDEDDFLKSFRRSVLDLKDDSREDGFEYFDMRLLDLSSGGFACYCSDDEYEFFKIKENSQTGELSIDGQSYVVKINKMIYEVDFITPNAKAIGMKKIGVVIEKNEDLTEHLLTIASSQSLLTQDDKKFEDLGR